MKLSSFHKTHTVHSLICLGFPSVKEKVEAQVKSLIELRKETRCEQVVIVVPHFFEKYYARALDEAVPPLQRNKFVCYPQTTMPFKIVGLELRLGKATNPMDSHGKKTLVFFAEESPTPLRKEFLQYLERFQGLLFCAQDSGLDRKLRWYYPDVQIKVEGVSGSFTQGLLES